MFLKFLIYQLKSCNGETGTSKGLIAAKFPVECEKFKKLLRTNNIDDEHQLKIQMISEQQICWKIFRRYIVMRIRMKISWHAFVLNITINELFFFSLLKTFQTQIFQGDSVEKMNMGQSDGMFKQYFGSEFDARNFNKEIPNLELLPEN